MTTNLVVGITVGQRDLQFLAMGPSGLVRVSPHRDCVGALHKALLGGHPYQLWLPNVPPPNIRKALPEVRNVDAIWRDGHLEFSDANLRPAIATDLGNPAPPRDALWLVPGLLAEALRFLELEHTDKKINLRRVLIFHTDRRPDPRFAATEPVAAAPLLAEFLHACIPALSPGDVEIVNILRSGEELTERDAFDNTILRIAAAQRIDDTLRCAANQVPKATIRLHLSGGIPGVGPVIEASARFRFDQVQVRGPDEFAPIVTVPAAPPITPVDTLHTRRRVRDLVSEGQFTAAALLGETTAPNQPWLRSLRVLTHYLQGYRVRAQATLAHLASQQTADWLKARLEGTEPKCLLVAFRAEAVLRAGDVSTGAQLTGTFLDVAVFDAIERHLSTNVSAVDWSSVCAIGSRLNLTARVLKRVGQPLYTGYRPDGIFCKEPWLDDWLDEWDELRLDKAWQKWLLAAAVGDQGETVLGESLQQLIEQFYARMPNGLILAYFRNAVIHSLPPNDTQIQKYRDLFASRGLWYHGGGQRYSLLDPHTWPAKVLKAFGIANALTLYEEGVQALTADIEAAPLA